MHASLPSPHLHVDMRRFGQQSAHHHQQNSTTLGHHTHSPLGLHQQTQLPRRPLFLALCLVDHHPVEQPSSSDDLDKRTIQRV